jgi:hypothetical protein
VITTHSLQDAPAVSLPPLPVQDDFETAETLSEFNCAVCERIGIEEYPDADTFKDRSGKSLRDARLAPNGQWICCQPCLSQLMFLNSSPYQQEALKRYERALQELKEALPDARETLRVWDCFSEIKPLSLEMAQIAIGVGGMRWSDVANKPAWAEANEAPEDILRQAAIKAIHEIEFKGILELRASVDFQHSMISAFPGTQHGAKYTTAHLSRIAGSLSSVLLRLKAAMVGEVVA